MTKAKFALVAVALSSFLTTSAAVAAEDGVATTSTGSVIHDMLANAEPAAPPEAQPGDPMAGFAQAAISDMMELGGLLTGDLPPRVKHAPAAEPAKSEQPTEQSLTVAAAPDGAPSLDGHLGLSLSMGPGGSAMGMKCGPGMGMCGPGMMPPFMHGRHHHHCPLDALTGANALSDEQYQKLYDIKGQFIASVVPKGLNMYMLCRQMKDLMTEADVDTKAVKSLERQISSATSELSMTVMDSIVAADQVLTPEQRKALHLRMIRSTLGGHEMPHPDVPHPEK